LIERLRRRGARSGRDPLARGESGQALLELALVAPILILILAGLVQFALIFERQIGIENATREAARRTATYAAPDVATAQLNANWGRDRLIALLGNTQSHEASRDTIEVCVYTPAAPDDIDVAGNPQAMVRIRESYRHPLFLPIIDLIVDPIDGVTDGALKITTSSTFRVEQSPGVNIAEGAHARNYSDSTACAR
jgi:Flp pilus assembly protein TadG